jgi:nitrogen-specific signal transduction histidine kinase
MHQARNFDTVIAPLLSKKTDEVVIGFHQARFDQGSRFGIGIRRAVNRGGAILLNIDATYLTEFRRRIGIGKMIQDIGSGQNIEYVVLQDEEGIVAASKGVEEMSSFDDDPFLQRALKEDSVRTREVSFNGRTVLECVQSFSVEGTAVGLFRVGISMTALRALEQQMIWRAAVISIMLIVLSGIVIGIIVAQQQATRATQETEKILTYSGMILDNMADAVITTDHRGIITIFNKGAYTLCRNTVDPVGNHIDTLLNGQLAFITESISSRTPIRNRELTLTCGDTSRVVILNSTLINTSSGTVESCTIVLHDITDLRRLEQHIRQKEKIVAMGELAGGVAHEIRNPLNTMYMIAQRFEKEFAPKTKVKEYRSLTSVLKNEAQRVNSIIQQFLRFARPPKLHVEDVSSKQFLDELRTMFSGEMKAKGISWSVVQESDVLLRIDRQQFKQAVINLILNALQATEKRGKISMKCSVVNAAVRFDISDSGKGIPKEHLEKIFNLYYTTKPNGTGLGLSIVQQIVGQHNGTISVESAEGKGTTVTIEIPNT